MPGAIRVLIVDDDVPTRVGLRVILSSEQDITVVGESATADDAVAQAATLAPDVVLMDVQLRDSDGLRATERILKSAGPDRPRVVVLTTFELDEYAYGALRAGASGFLLKRARAEDIVDAVRTVAEGGALPMPEMSRRLISTHFDHALAEPRDVASLTDREEEVLTLIAAGLSNTEIATRLDISTETVKSHVKHLFTKLGVRDRAQAVIAAYESGLVVPGSSPS